MGATGSKIKGKAMKAEGKITGDKVRRAQGHVVEGKGEAEGVVDRVARKARNAADRVRGKIDRTASKQRTRRAGAR